MSETISESESKFQWALHAMRAIKEEQARALEEAEVTLAKLKVGDVVAVSKENIKAVLEEIKDIEAELKVLFKKERTVWQEWEKALVGRRMSEKRDAEDKLRGSSDEAGKMVDRAMKLLEEAEKKRVVEVLVEGLGSVLGDMVARRGEELARRDS